MNEMFRRIEFIKAYIYELFIITKVDWSDQLNILKLVLKNLIAKGLKCNIGKLFFGQTEMEYLVF